LINLIAKGLNSAGRPSADENCLLLIDAPPILLHPEAHPLLWGIDQAVVILESGRSRKDQARALLDLLHHAEVEVLGCVLNRYQPELPSWIGGSKLP